MRLIMALALLLSGFTVTSGMSATAGERKSAIAISVNSSSKIKQISGTGRETVTCQAFSARRALACSLVSPLTSVLRTPASVICSSW